jgi:hypothetical protein
MSQLEIDERILDLKNRVEVIEQMVGMNSVITGDVGHFSRKPIMEALAEIMTLKEAITRNKSIEAYLQVYSRAL